VRRVIVGDGPHDTHGAFQETAGLGAALGAGRIGDWPTGDQ